MSKYIILFLFVITIFAKENDIKKGKNLFNGNCAICHSINGRELMGPDLNLTSYTKTKKQIKNYISEPSKYFKQWGYTANAMPELPISEEDKDFIVNYIDSLQPFKKWMKK